MITNRSLRNKFGFRNKNSKILSRRRNKGRHCLINIDKTANNIRYISLMNRRRRSITARNIRT